MATISFQLPDSIVDQLRHDLGDLDVAVKEAALIELYRQGQLSHGKLAVGLGLSRYETDGVLKRHNVVEDQLTREELEQQVDALRTSLAK